MRMTAIEKMIHEMNMWAAFISEGGDSRIATTEWLE